MVLQVQEVYLMTFETDVAAPCVKSIVILHHDRQFLVIVEILLQEHQVVVFLHQVLANAHRARAARSFGIDVEHQNLLGQSVDVQRGNAELLRLLGLPRNSHAKRHDCRENVSFKHTYHYDLFGYQIVNTACKDNNKFAKLFLQNVKKRESPAFPYNIDGATR